MNDEREAPEEHDGPREEPATIDLSQEIAKGYVLMPVDSTTDIDIVDDMGGLPDPEPVSMEPPGEQLPQVEPPAGPSPYVEE